ncbi:unnamed protein product [Debaryomyces tyrocola]|nr:unnamed protein product [Debaryomyces tyrocola]
MLSARPVLRSAARSVAAVSRNLRVARPTQLATRCYASTKAAPTEVSSILEERIRGVSDEANLNETGRVLSVGEKSHHHLSDQHNTSRLLY